MAPEERGGECEHWSTLQELSASIPVSCLLSRWPARLAGRHSALQPHGSDRLLGAVTGYPHGNWDEEVLELKDWENTAARGLSAQRPPLPKGRLPPTHQAGHALRWARSRH